MDGDIRAILLRIKDNIRVVESGLVAPPILAEIESDFRNLMELLKLFLISERDSYYGFILMNMSFRAAFDSDGIAGIVLNEFPPVYESNPLLLCKFTLQEIIYIVCHEIDHVVLNHPAEMVRLGQDDQDLLMKFNLAADAAVNDRINDEIERKKFKFLRQPDGLITSEVLSQMFALKKLAHGENYLYYFDKIKDIAKPETCPENQAQSMMNHLDMSEGQGGNSPSGMSEEGGPESDENSAGVFTANCGQPIKDHDWRTIGDEEDAAAAARELVNAAVEMMNDEARGLMPGWFMSQVQELNQPPKLTWQQILKRYVGTIAAGKRKTRTRLNRRQPGRFDLSGSMDEKVLKIVVAIDTSASVDDGMISAIINEVFAILAKRKHEITIIECDAKVQRVYRVLKPSDVQKKITGRGGTAFSPAINYINNDRCYRDALMIYFTDGYGERKIPRPRTYRNIWVVFDHVKNLSVEEPYGIVIALER